MKHAETIQQALKLIEQGPSGYPSAIPLLEETAQKLRRHGQAKGGGVTTLLNLVSSELAPQDGLKRVIDELQQTAIFQYLENVFSTGHAWKLTLRASPHVTSHSSIDPVLGQQLPVSPIDCDVLFKLFLTVQHQLIELTKTTRFELMFDRIQINSHGVLVLKTDPENGVSEGIAAIRWISSFLTHGERYPTSTAAWCTLGRFEPLQSGFQLTHDGSFLNSRGESMRFESDALWEELKEHFQAIDGEGQFEGDFALDRPLPLCPVENLYLAMFQSREVRPQELLKLARIQLPIASGETLESEILVGSLSTISEAKS